MAKANRTCYCCGHEYYYCPSCPSDRKDPQIYTMWDSEICKDIFNTLVSESTKKITIKECKEKLIELGVKDIDITRDSVKRHIDKVMSYEEKVDVEIEKKEEIIETTVEEIVEELNAEEPIVELNTSEVSTVSEQIEVIGSTEYTVKTPNKKRKNSFKNKDN